LQAYLDGDLSPEEREAFELQLAEDDDLRSETEDTRALVSLLRGLPAYEVPRSFALTPEMVRAAGAPPPKVIRLLPMVRTLAVAAMLAFIVVSAFTGYQLVVETGEDGVTNQPTNASEDATGESATDGVVTGVGESAASGAVPPEQPGSAELPQTNDTGTSSGQQGGSDPSGTSADDQTIWLLSSAGFGVLALALGGYWVYLVRTGSSSTHSA
jgi:anti-sigma factor RsiW